MQLEEGTSCSLENPFMSSFISTSISSPSGRHMESSKQAPSQKLFPYLFATKDITIESKVPPSSRLMTILEGLNVPGDSGNPPEPPPWLDRQLFDRGRDFYRKYLFCLSFCDLICLIFVFSFERGLRPLIYTNQSDTPQKALKRYFSTFLHIRAWYKGDVWDPDDPSHKDIMAIRSVHKKVAKLCNSFEENDHVTNISVSEKGHKEPDHPLYKSIQQDIMPYVEVSITEKQSPPHYISQLTMSLTQYTFIGLLIAHPEKFGAGGASEEEFAALIHFWRGIGWLLGIEDKYNFCNGSVAATRALCLEFERFLTIPYLSKATWNYEHMSTSLMSGMQIIVSSISYPVMFRYLAHTIGISVPSFVKRMSYRDCFNYWMMRLVVVLLVFFPNFVQVLSSHLSHMISSLEDKSDKPGKWPNSSFPLRKNYA